MQPVERPDPFVRRVVIAVAIAGAAYVAWQIRGVAIIVFGGLIFATLLSALAEHLMKWTPLKRKASVVLVVFALVLFLSVLLYWVGDQAFKQFEQLRQTLPGAISSLVQWLQDSPIGSVLLSQGADLEDMTVPWSNLAGFTGTALGALGNALLMTVIGVYLAVSPERYERGLVRLAPPIYRERLNDALMAAGHGLRQWLLGQMAAMLVVGALTAIGLAVLGVPLAMVLGIIAGLAEFVPFIGPLAAGVLSVVFAFTEGPVTALHVALLFLLLQQLEGNVITPLIQRRAVNLPPALALLSVVIFGVLFGIAGILFSTPLMVVVMILVKKLYIEDALEGESLEEAQTEQKDRAPG